MFPHLSVPICQLQYLVPPVASVIPVVFHQSLFSHKSSNPIPPSTFRSQQYDPGFGQSWTLDPAVKPFGSTVKKEAGKVVETSEEKDEEFPREKDEEFPKEYWTLYPVVLDFGLKLKNEQSVAGLVQSGSAWDKLG